VNPPIETDQRLLTWVGVGGTPESVVRAAHYGLPLMLAIIGGSPRRFAAYADLYHRSLAQFGHGTLPIGVHSPGHVAATDEQAREELWPHYAGLMNRIGAERGWQPITRGHFDREAGPDGSLYVGSPETVAKKIAATYQALGLTRFHLKYSNGTLPHQAQMTSLELYGTKVAPRVRELLDAAGYTAGELVQRD
jgi:alkanesulfonate monooxygenase SsuD/methylene tetrahydromethanopterin reductase-like flavin-dependent oxidoreductase (luciferase family)